MTNFRVFDDKTQLAEAAAATSIDLLSHAIDKQGSATWVLAGGSTPLLAYKIIATNHVTTLDWSKVTVLMGDERIGPLDGPDNNWHAIEAIIGFLPTTKLRPRADLSAEQAAADYSQQLMSLPTIDNGLPRFDLLWLGLGEDGHTLSLFPQHSGLSPSSELVVPIHESPKPPRDRISLSLRALQGTQNALVLASGPDKKQAVMDAKTNFSLPISLATSIIATHEGAVQWLVDKDAAPTD
jgi:6-phosphogluconolactonase